MSRRAGVVTIRTILTLLGLAVLAYAGGIAVQVVSVVRPAAQDLRGRTRDLLRDHDAIATNLRRAQILRREISLLVPPNVSLRGLGPVRSVEALEADARMLVDAGTGLRTSVDRSDVPFEMRLLLAQAIEQEAAVAVFLVEALRAVELGRGTSAIDALRASGLRSDSSAVLLSRAQAVALEDLLRREDGLEVRLRRLVQWAIGWAIAGLLLGALGLWIVRQRLYIPVREMEVAVRRITGGDLTTEVPVPRLDELGRLASHLNDMTAVLRERAGDERRRRENLVERFGRILDASSNEICIFDASTLRLLQANRGARANLGYSAEAMAALSLPDLLREYDRPALDSLLGRLRTGEQTRLLLSTRQRRRDGSTYPVEMALQYSTEGESAVFVTVAEDAGVRQRVRELDQHLRDFALAEQKVLLGGDLDAALRLIGPMATEALRAARFEVWRDESGTERCIAAWDARLGVPLEGEALAAIPLAYDPRQLVVPIRVAARPTGRLLIVPSDGGGAWSAEEHTFAGSVAELVARAMEAAERRVLETALARAQRMDSIGQLAGGVAHDFNNILTAILGNLEACRMDLTPGDPMDAALAEAEQAALRAADLTRQLLTFARHQIVEVRLVDLNGATRDADRMLRRLLGAAVEVRTDLASTLEPVRLGPGQFEQVLVNLAVNARDAMPGGGTITIATCNVTLGATELANIPGLTPGRFVELAVTDTGVGMPKETLDRVFEPFFTTKSLGEGTGLGLAVCYGIVRQAGGEITVTSAPGRGTSFRVWLPAAEGSPEHSIERSAAKSAGGNETILVVEDESAIRELLVRALRARGYHVLQAADGRDALEVAAAHDGKVDLLLSDVVMPRMSGPDAARLLKVARPGLRTLFMSGYPAGALFESGAIDAVEFLAKPITPDQVCRRVRDVLDGGATPTAVTT